jgi:Tol biopolymer transport system component
MPSWGGEPELIKPDSLAVRATDSHGGQLLYMSLETGDWEVYLLPAHGGDSVNLSASDRSQDGLATFSPGGEQVAFLSNRSGNWALWVIELDGETAAPARLMDLPSPPTGVWTDESISWGP